jgi:galactokinase
VRVRAPSRVNLIGDHTDYTGGLVFPMAIDRWTEISYEIVDDVTTLTSADESGTVTFPKDAQFDAAFSPRWGRYVLAVAAQLANARSINGHITTTIPVGAGLSSSAALEMAVALALGSKHSSQELALLGQRAEQLATGVPTGIMDQLCIASAQEQHGTLIDCHTLNVQHIPIPEDIEIVVQFIAHRTLEGSEYGDRVAQCATAEALIGPLRMATMNDVASIKDSTIQHRAHHVVSENARVTQFIDALSQNDYAAAGLIMKASHHSLAEDFATSTKQMNDAVAVACATPGVFGARMTGGGFGGCIVLLCAPGTEVQGWRVQPVGAVHHVN